MDAWQVRFHVLPRWIVSPRLAASYYTSEVAFVAFQKPTNHICWITESARGELRARQPFYPVRHAHVDLHAFLIRPPLPEHEAERLFSFSQFCVVATLFLPVRLSLFLRAAFADGQMDPDQHQNMDMSQNPITDRCETCAPDKCSECIICHQG